MMNEGWRTSHVSVKEPSREGDGESSLLPLCPSPGGALMATGLRPAAERDAGTRAEFAKVHVLNCPTKLSPPSSRFTSHSRANGSGRCTHFSQGSPPRGSPLRSHGSLLHPRPFSFSLSGPDPPPQPLLISSFQQMSGRGGDPAATGPSTGGSPSSPCTSRAQQCACTCHPRFPGPALLLQQVTDVGATLRGSLTEEATPAEPPLPFRPLSQ